MIAEQILSHSRRRPDDVALLVDNAGDGTRSCTYAELSELAARIARIMAPTLRGDPLILVTPPTPVSVAAVIALEGARAPIILVPHTLPPRELLGVYRSSRARKVLHPHGAAERIAGVKSQLDIVPGLTLSTVVLPDDNGPAMSPLTGSCLVQMTSGSLGASRLAVRSLEAVVLEIQAIGQCLEFDPEKDRVLCGSSIAHSYGSIGGLLAPLYFGLPVVLAPDTAAVRSLLELTNPSIVVGLASTYASMLSQPTVHRVLRTARFLLSAGAPLPAELYEDFLHQTGASIRQDYGTTETGTIAIDHGMPVSPHGVGYPLAHVDVRITPPTGHLMGGGKSGEIQVHSAAVASHYVADGRLVPAIAGDGWYHTGDVGWWDDRGHLNVGRRLRPPIELPSGVIHPETVEDAIAGRPGVRDVAVVPVEHRGGLALKAVVAAATLEPEDIRVWCQAQLPPEQVPEIIDVVSELPRSPAGKVLHKYMIESDIDIQVEKGSSRPMR